MNRTPNIYSSKAMYCHFINMKNFILCRGLGEGKTAFLTWTNSKEMDRAKTYGKFMKFFNNFKTRVGGCSYVAVMERQESGSWHFHVVLAFKDVGMKMKQAKRHISRGMRLKWTISGTGDVLTEYMSKQFGVHKGKTVFMSRDVPRVANEEFTWLGGKWRSDLVSAGKEVQKAMDISSEDIQDWYFNMNKKEKFGIYRAWREDGELGLVNFMKSALGLRGIVRKLHLPKCNLLSNQKRIPLLAVIKKLPQNLPVKVEKIKVEAVAMSYKNEKRVVISSCGIYSPCAWYGDIRRGNDVILKEMRLQLAGCDDADEKGQSDAELIARIDIVRKSLKL